jgi:hypothetical protein
MIPPVYSLRSSSSVNGTGAYPQEFLRWINHPLLNCQPINFYGTMGFDADNNR